MATNLEALKDLYVKAGGSATDVADVETSAGMIEKLGDVIGGDGGGQLVINLTRESPVSTRGTYDVPFDEIDSALKNGKIVIAKENIESTILFYYPTSHGEITIFESMPEIGENVTVYSVDLDSNGGYVFSSMSYPTS